MDQLWVVTQKWTAGKTKLNAHTIIRVFKFSDVKTPKYVDIWTPDDIHIWPTTEKDHFYVQLIMTCTSRG